MRRCRSTRSLIPWVYAAALAGGLAACPFEPQGPPKLPPVIHDSVPPTVSLRASSSTLTEPGVLTLFATASDNVVVGKVEFYKRRVGVDAAPLYIGEVVSEPHQITFPAIGLLRPSDNGSLEFSARAFDAVGNVGLSNTVPVRLAIVDRVAPVVRLDASGTRITSPGLLRLAARVDEAFARLEWFENGASVGEVAGGEDPQLRRSFTAADNGPRLYTAAATDPSGNVGTSPELSVAVDIRWDLIVSIGGAGIDRVLGVAADETGGLYVGGFTLSGLEGVGADSDAFVARLDSDGAPVWVRTFDTGAFETGVAVAAGAGAVYMLVRSVVVGQAGASGYLVKYDLSGNQEWASRLSPSGNDSPTALALDAAAEAYVVGTTDADLNGETNQGGNDAFVVKYGSDGSVRWTRLLGSALAGGVGDDRGAAVALDGSGAVFVAGYGDGSFGGAANAGSFDAFVAKFDPQGAPQWIRQIGSSGSDAAVALAAGPEGALYVAVRTTGTLGGGQADPLGNAALLRLQPDGSVLWARVLDSGDTDDPRSLAAGAGGVYLSGNTWGSLEGHSPQGVSDMFLAWFDDFGSLQSLDALGTSESDDGAAVVVRPDGMVYVAGTVSGTITGVPSRGMSDGFVARIGPARR
jgi:hypothetical protein